MSIYILIGGVSIIKYINRIMWGHSSLETKEFCHFYIIWEGIGTIL